LTFIIATMDSEVAISWRPSALREAPAVSLMPSIDASRPSRPGCSVSPSTTAPLAVYAFSYLLMI
jgi:hypothetical protein